MTTIPYGPGSAVNGAWLGASYFGPAYFGGVPIEDEKGGAKRVRLTKEQFDAMDDFGRIQMGLPTREQEKLVPEVLEIPILEEALEIPEIEVVPLIDGVLESQDLQETLETEDDIGLILALIEAHNA